MTSSEHDSLLLMLLMMLLWLLTHQVTGINGPYTTTSGVYFLYIDDIRNDKNETMKLYLYTCNCYSLQCLLVK